MATSYPPEFKDFCTGLDVALTYDNRRFSKEQDVEKQFAEAVERAAYGFDCHDLDTLASFLSTTLAEDDAGETLEDLWMSFKPTRVFFSVRGKKLPDPPYVFLFKRVLRVIRELRDQNR